MEETKPRPGVPGDRAQIAAEKLRALRERANLALDEHRQRLSQIESELSLRVRQLAEEFETASTSLERRALVDRDDEVAALRQQLDEGRTKHERFVEQLAMARRQLDAIQAQPCPACQEAALQLADCQTEIRQLREQLAAAEHQHEEDRARHEKFTDQVAAARKAIAELQARTNEQTLGLQAELDAAVAARREAEERASQRAQELQALSAQCDEQSGQCAGLRDEIEQIQAACAGEAQLRQSAEVAAADLRQQIEAGKSELAAMQETWRAERDALESQIAEANKSCQELSNDQQRWQNERIELESALAEAVAARDAAGEDAGVKASELADAQQLLEAWEQRQIQWESERSELDAALAEARDAAADRAALAEELTAAKSHQRDLDSRLASLETEHAALADSLAASTHERQQLQQELDAGRQRIADFEAAADDDAVNWESRLHTVRAEGEAHAAARAELQRTLDECRAELAQLRQSTCPSDDLQQLQARYELALSDMRDLKAEADELRGQLQAHEASAESAPEDLEALRTERDALAQQVDELGAAAAAAAANAGQVPEADDLKRRFEMALDDVRQLKQENALLRDQIADASKAPSGTAAGPLDWAAQKARLLASLEEEDGDSRSDPARRKERLAIEDAIQSTDRVVAEKDRLIAELRAAHETCGDQRRRDEVLDADATIAAERQRLAALQAEWESKVRSAELEISVERAKVARDQAAVKERQFELQKLEPAAGAGERGEAKPRRGWRTALGLGEEGDEGSKAN
jgi:chromosome segregation ATPase